MYFGEVKEAENFEVLNRMDDRRFAVSEYNKDLDVYKNKYCFITNRCDQTIRLDHFSGILLIVNVEISYL